jgi:ferric-dicitrate binding protein FerR (iron transport regulator)
MPTSSPDDHDLIECLEVGEAPRSPDEAAARAPYERLIARLGDLDEIEPAPGWEDRAVARWRRARSRRRRRVALVVLAAVVLLIAVVRILA